MKKRLFTDLDIAPTESLLRGQLGMAMNYYHAILRESGGYRKRWQYNHGSGWILKVDAKLKALFYLAPFDEGVEVSLTVRDQERATFLANKDFDSIQPQLDAATKYSGGYALRFSVESSDESISVSHFLGALMVMRGSPAL